MLKKKSSSVLGIGRWSDGGVVQNRPTCSFSKWATLSVVFHVREKARPMPWHGSGKAKTLGTVVYQLHCFLVQIRITWWSGGSMPLASGPQLSGRKGGAWILAPALTSKCKFLYPKKKFRHFFFLPVSHACAYWTFCKITLWSKF
jgi:hypothetical protein